MYIEELKGGGEVESVEEGNSFAGDSLVGSGSIVVSGAKRVLVGAGARALFYPTLLYNVVRNKIQAEFRWWDEVDEVCFTRLCCWFRNSRAFCGHMYTCACWF